MKFGQNQVEKHPWKIDDNPFNEFNTEYLATMSFPTLPDGNGDPTNYAIKRNVA